MVPILETERLRMRGWRPEDHAPFSAFLADEDSARFIGGACGPEDAWRRMATQLGHWALRGYGSWVLEEKATGAWIGYSGLWYPLGWADREVMWGLMATARGRGYATEAALRARAFAYETLQWPTAVSYIAPENEPSRRVAERLGARFEGQAKLRLTVADVWRHPSPHS
jgi:RimJ/RimL family protein N-acetyltransferase